LWLRLLGRGNVQLQAIEEVASLPPDAPERVNALELFSNLKATLEATQPTDQDDEDLIMQLSPIYLEQLQEAEQRGEQRGELRGEQRGELRGEQRGAANLILKQLQRRFGALPVAVQEQVLGLLIDRLDTLEESMADFSTVAELLGWLG
jgi:predicted transposase YdaD